MIAGFTGPRSGMSEAQAVTFSRLLRDLGVTELHLGDCLGADALAHAISTRLHDIRLVGHPCNLTAQRACLTYDEEWAVKPPLQRNRDIVTCSEVLLATPTTLQEERRSGTWATIRAAWGESKPVYAVEPLGRVYLLGQEARSLDELTTVNLLHYHEVVVNPEESS